MVTASCNIPIYHKIACKNMKQSEKCYKYGNIIGIASKAISAGDHVHTHNLESMRGRGDKVNRWGDDMGDYVRI